MAKALFAPGMRVVLTFGIGINSNSVFSLQAKQHFFSLSSICIATDPKLELVHHVELQCTPVLHPQPLWLFLQKENEILA